MDRHIISLTVSATGRGVPPALDKSRIGGLKGPLDPLVVIGQTEAPSRGPKTAGGQAPPREGAVP
jgi:hypothetical protein